MPAPQIRAGAIGLLALLGVSSSIGCFAHQYRSNPRVAFIDGDPIVQMQPPGKMPSVQESTLVPAEKHSDKPDDVDRVVGLVAGTEARAYPIGLLDRFEVVNDSIFGFSFVVARCALTGVAAVYDRHLGDRTLTFENSGALWRDTLVLQDRETKSFWCAATGRALAGALAGAKLRGIPALVTRTENWEKAHPESLYLDLDRSTIVPLVMRLYEASAAQGLSGVKTVDKRYKPKDEVFIVSHADEALAFRAKEIEAAGRVRAVLAGRPIAIEWDSALQTPRARALSDPRGEIAIIPMYWFAVRRHFARVRTFADVSDHEPRAASR